MASASTLRALSRGRDVVACRVEEHVMYFLAEYWLDGRRVWRVEHDGQAGFDHLVAEGELPPQYEELRARRFAEHAAENADAEDEYETTDVICLVPGDVAGLVSGFRYDDPEHGLDGWSKPLYDVLGAAPPAARTAAPAAKPWWKIW
jgi:hypothetical protein